MKQTACFVLVLLVHAFVFGQKSKAPVAPPPPPAPYFPAAGNWERRKPEDLGLSSAKIQDAIQYAKAEESTTPKDLQLAHYQTFGREPFGVAVGPHQMRGPSTGLIIYKGYIVGEWGEPDRVDMTFSVTKSFVSTIMGLALDQGLIRSVHDTAYKSMAPIWVWDPQQRFDVAEQFGQPQLLNLFNTPHNRRITWDHLLRQTSSWEGTLWGKPDWADRPSTNVNEWMSKERAAPGTVHEYNDVRVNALALAALNLWRKPLPLVIKEKIMDPIGASPTWRWFGYHNSWVVMDGVPVQAVGGGGHWGGGMFINAFDLARFGLLSLHKGKWKNQQLLSSSWYDLATTPTPVQRDYGFMNFYLNTDQKAAPSAPASTFFHLGNGTNLVIVAPEKDLVVVARWVKREALDGILKRLF